MQTRWPCTMSTTETWFEYCMDDNNISIEGFSLERKDRSDVRTGGWSSLPHTSSPGSAIGRFWLVAHVGSAREPRVRINSAGIWPRAAVRQISVVFNIFRLVHPKVHLGCVVCEGRQVCSEKQYRWVGRFQMLIRAKMYTYVLTMLTAYLYN